MSKTAVLGIGNLLLKDDGLGIHLIRELERQDFDEVYKVELIDGGTYIFDLLDVFIKYQRIIILDSFKGGHIPGTVYRATPEDLGRFVKANTSLHDVQILDLIKNVNLMGYYPEVIVIGVEPENISFDLELSGIIKEQIPKVIELIKKELSVLYYA